MTSHSVRKSS